MTETIETGCSYQGEEKKAYFSSSEKKWITRIKKLMDKYPGEVEVIREPDENDGCLYAKIPKEWFRISPPKQLNVSDEERQKRKERAMMASKQRKNGDKNGQREM